MFTSCPNTEHDFQVQLHNQGSSKDAGDFKHHVDYFFVRALLDTDGPLGPWSRTEQPEEAELFVVPGLCSQSYQEKCEHDHAHNVQQMEERLHASPWYPRRVHSRSTALAWTRCYGAIHTSSTST